MFEEVVTVSFRGSGHKSREDATEALKKKSEERATRVQVHVMIQWES